LGGKNIKIIWVSLREEPIIYINGKPHVLRNLKSPLSNIIHTGINKARVEELEERLKKDIMKESNDYNEKFLVFDEHEDFSIYGYWEDLSNDLGVLTAKDVYDIIKNYGYNCLYHRLPITDEQAPKISDFDR
jgi:hypothetical protein